MSDDNSPVIEATDGLVADVSPVESAEPSFTEIAAANEKAEADAMEALLRSKGLVEAPVEELPADEQPEEVEAEVSDESEEVETSSEETTDDDTPVEDDDADEDNPDDSPEYEVLTPDALDGYKISLKIKGEEKEWTLAQIRKELARVESASELSHEAKTQLASLEERQEALEAREAQLGKQEALSAEELKLAQFNAHIHALEEQKDQAMSFEEDKKLALEIKKFKDAARGLEDEITEVKDAARQKRLLDQQRILKEHNFQAGKELGSYVTSLKLSQLEWDAINESANLLMMSEKARLWDDLQSKSKGKPKPVRSFKTKGSGSKPVPKQTIKDQEAAARMQAGVGTEEDADAALARIMAAKGL